jgi:hypothetical protein
VTEFGDKELGAAIRSCVDLIIQMRVEIIRQLDVMNASLLDALATLQTNAETAGRLLHEQDLDSGLEHASKIKDIKPVLEQQVAVLRDLLKVLRRAYSH